MKVFSSIKKMISIEPPNREAGRISICILIAASIFIASPAWSADYYIAQSAVGNNNATSCANAKAVSYLTGSWSGKVAAGDTVHLCGTITSALTIGGAGSVGSIITIKFEDNAKFSSTAFSSSGAIIISSKDYITVDGGTNGIIENTDNGISKGTDQASIGVNAHTSNNLEIKNLTVRNIYIKEHFTTTSCTGKTIRTTTGINVVGGSDVKIHNNTVTEMATGIAYLHMLNNSTTYSNIEIYSNVTSRTNWGMAIGITAAGDVVNNLLIYGNDIIIGSNFACDTDIGYHENGIILYGDSNGALNGVDIYNNYIHGEAIPDGEWTATGGIYQTVINTTNERIFNNLFVGASNNPSNAYIQIGFSSSAVSTTDPQIYNNTIVGYLAGTYQGRGIAHYKNNGNATIKNNIISSCGIGLHIEGTDYVLNSDNNVFYNNSKLAFWGGYLTTLAGLQTKNGGCPGLGKECNSITTNPALNSYYTVPVGSPVRGAGVNLTSLGITTLNSDKSGIARPSSGTWDIGAYVPTSTTKPKAPRNLRITR